MRWRDFSSLPLLPDDYFDSQPRRVHFIGIGGIGMSALAQVLLARGHKVSGSDAHDSSLLQTLRAAGAEIFIGHDASALDGAPPDAIIWGSAIRADNPEREWATQHDVPQWHRAQLLACLVNAANFSIAVSGTHGKSTTSAMVAHILEKTGRNPTAILGAVYSPFGSNVRIGDPDLLVVEADESDGSFTLCAASVAVVTNVEAEHLENYDDSASQLWHAFEAFADNAIEVVLNADDAELPERLDADGWALLYGIDKIGVPSSDENTHFNAQNVESGAGKTSYTLRAGEQEIGRFTLRVPGHHNLSNALGAISACYLEHIDSSSDERSEFLPEEVRKIATALEDFGGVARRFEFVGEADDVLVYEDYAHHPTEVASALYGARDWLQRPLTAVFQPHRFSRTQQMGHLFGPSFEAATNVIVTELYSAFETPIEGVSGRNVFNAIRAAWPEKTIEFVPELAAARTRALELTPRGGAIMLMGAGTIGAQGQSVVKDLQEREN